MMRSRDSSKQIIETLLTPLGITLNGNQPFDIQVHNNALYPRVLRQAAMGLGQSYVEGWWDCEKLDILFTKLLQAGIDSQVQIPWRYVIKQFLARFINFQTRYDSRKLANQHYDLGNDLFKAMLDQRMQYSCGYWKQAVSLEGAQEAKLRLTCQKLYLEPGMKLLDIGCGWGGLARYAAEQFGVQVTGITVSKQQAAYAKEYCKGLPVEILLQDYRDLKGQFDRVVSVGMFEHVGHVNYDLFMEKIKALLGDNGLFLLHTIGVNETNYLPNEWIAKYIFPTGMLPSPFQMGKAIEKYFVLEDWHNFGAYYDPTLMAWHENFVHHWEKLKAHYDERFYRMWNYYLLSCAGCFRARKNQLWQLVLSKNGVPGGYVSIR